MRRRQETDYWRNFGVEHFGGLGGPVNRMHPGEEVGPYEGRGPKNYRRSDDRILEDVMERLTRNSMIDATDIEVKVQEGEVTLKGTVEDRRMKRLAEDEADAVWGVKDVHNQIQIKSSSQKAA